MKEKINKETALQYWYDYGLDKAAEILNITTEALTALIEDKVDHNWNKPSLNKNAKVNYINPKIAEFIEKNYSGLYYKYVKDKNHNVFYQNDEDIFHNALIKLSADFSEPKEDVLLKAFDKVFRTIKWENNTRNNQMKKKEMTIDWLENNDDNDDDE